MAAESQSAPASVLDASGVQPLAAYDLQKCLSVPQRDMLTAHLRKRGDDICFACWSMKMKSGKQSGERLLVVTRFRLLVAKFPRMMKAAIKEFSLLALDQVSVSGDGGVFCFRPHAHLPADIASGFEKEAAEMATVEYSTKEVQDLVASVLRCRGALVRTLDRMPAELRLEGIARGNAEAGGSDQAQGLALAFLSLASIATASDRAHMAHGLREALRASAEALDLGRIHGITDGDAEALVQTLAMSSAVPELAARDLPLESALGAVADLVGTSSSLRALRLRSVIGGAGQSLGRGQDGLAVVCRALEANGNLPLVELSLRSNDLGDKAAMALGTALAAGLGRLQRLDVSHCKLRSKQMAALLQGLASGRGRSPGLQALAVGHNDIGRKESGAWAEWLAASSLEMLDLSGTNCHVAVIVNALAASTPQALRALDVSGNKLSSAEDLGSIVALAGSVGTLQALSLSDTAIDGKGACAIAALAALNAGPGALERLSLDLSHTRFGAQGATLLCPALVRIRGLTALYLAHTDLGVDDAADAADVDSGGPRLPGAVAVAAVLDSLVHRPAGTAKLQVLNLSGSHFSDGREVAAAFASLARAEATALTELRLAGSAHGRLKEHLVTVVAIVRGHPTLEHLDVSDHNAGDAIVDSVRLLVEPKSRLRTCLVHGNGLSAEGWATVVAAAQGNRRLTALVITASDVDAVAKTATSADHRRGLRERLRTVVQSAQLLVESNRAAASLPVAIPVEAAKPGTTPTLLWAVIRAQQAKAGLGASDEVLDSARGYADDDGGDDDGGRVHDPETTKAPEPPPRHAPPARVESQPSPAGPERLLATSSALVVQEPPPPEGAAAPAAWTAFPADSGGDDVAQAAPVDGAEAQWTAFGDGEKEGAAADWAPFGAGPDGLKTGGETSLHESAPLSSPPRAPPGPMSPSSFLDAVAAEGAVAEAAVAQSLETTSAPPMTSEDFLSTVSVAVTVDAGAAEAATTDAPPPFDPRPMTGDAFLDAWNSVGEAQRVFRLRAGALGAATRTAEVEALGLAVVADLDPNPANVVAAGRLASLGRKGTVLTRLEVDPDCFMCRATVACPDAHDPAAEAQVALAALQASVGEPQA